MRARIALSVAALTLTASGKVRAEDAFALQTFEPAPAGDHFFSRPDAATDGHLRLHAGLLANYAHRPLHVTQTSTNDGVDNGELVRHQLYLNLDVSFVLFHRLLLHVDLPFAVLQSGDTADSMAGMPSASSGKLADLRLGARYAFYGNKLAPLSLAVAADVWLPTGSAANYTGDGGVRFNPKAIASGRVDLSNQHFVYAVDAGFLLRPSHEAASTSVGSAMTFGAAAAILLAQDTVQIGPEVYGRSQFDGWDTTPIEAMLGSRLRLGEFAVSLAVGTSFTKAVGAAPFRGILGLAWSPQLFQTTTAGP